MHLLKLSAALAFALTAGHAHAAHVSLDPQGLGQGLLFPFFTTHNDQSTLLTMQNTSAQGKALKLRVLESQDGIETLTLNLYLPAFGKWSGALTLGDGSPDAPAWLIPSAPNVGCTVPAIPSVGIALRPYWLDDVMPAANIRTREGLVEIVEMGTLDAELAQLARDPTEANCRVFTDRTAEGGIWNTSPNTGIGAPSGKLRGSATILDVAGGTAFSYAAPAFGGLANKARHTTLETSEQGVRYISGRPALTDILVDDGDTIDVTVTGSDGEPTTLEYAAVEGHNAIGALLAATNATTDYSVYGGLGARTEWIVSFPTRAAAREAYASFPPVPGNASSARPFSEADVDCESAAFIAWDPNGVKLDTQTAVDLCGAAQVLQFAEGETPVSTQLATEDDPVIPVPSPIGTARLDFGKFDADTTRASHGDRNGKCVVGLPAWVMAVQSYDNDNLEGGRVATFPVTNVASGAVDVVDCDTLDR